MLKRIKKKMRFAGKAGEKDTNKCNAGFSLIEVIAVTIIIGVMATMLMPAIDGAGSKARNAKLKNDLATLDQAIATYKLEQGSVPASLDNLVPGYIAMVYVSPGALKYSIHACFNVGNIYTTLPTL